MITTKDPKRSLFGEGFSTARPCLVHSSTPPREGGEEKGETKSTVGVTVIKDLWASADAV